MNKLSLLTAIVVSLLGFALAPAMSSEVASADDTARFLAGMTPSAGSPLTPLTRDHGWQQHAKAMDKAFAEIEKRQVGRIRTWGETHLLSPRSTVFYMFSGPDFLYVNAFFPRASTYVLSGLEPTGPLPDLLTQRSSIFSNLASLHHSTRTLFDYSFFITRKMKDDLQTRGTLPLLYVFLARSGKKIRDISFVNIDGKGEAMADSGPKAKMAARGVKIVFADADGRVQTLYYFSTDLANSGLKRSGFLAFCEKLGVGDSFLKSASYLMHKNQFSHVRDFLLSNSVAIVQDDSGIPLKFFNNKKWALNPFGHYLGPIEIFEGVYQANMKELFRKSQAKPIDFGVGYRWRPGESNLLLAVKNAATTGN